MEDIINKIIVDYFGVDRINSGEVFLVYEKGKLDHIIETIYDINDEKFQITHKISDFIPCCPPNGIFAEQWEANTQKTKIDKLIDLFSTFKHTKHDT